MPLTLSKAANERSTYGVTIAFYDETGTPMTPSAITWTLTDSTGKLINSRDSVSVSPAEEVVIVLSGDDLPISSSYTSQRVLTVEATYSSDLGVGLPFKEQITFAINDLVAVPDPIIP